MTLPGASWLLWVYVFLTLGGTEEPSQCPELSDLPSLCPMCMRVSSNQGMDRSCFGVG